MAPVNDDLSQLMGRLAAGIDDVIEAEMSTALEAVGDEGPPSAGELVEIGLPILMGRLFGDGTTGRLRIWQERRTMSRIACWPCWFANGSCRRTSGRKWRRLSLPLAARLGGFWLT